MKKLIILIFCMALMLNCVSQPKSGNVRKIEYDHLNNEIKMYSYKVSGGEWVLDKIHVWKDLNGDGKKDEENDALLYTMNYNFGKLAYISRNTETLAMINKADISQFELIDLSEKKEIIKNHLTKPLTSFTSKLEANLKKLTEQYKNGELNLTISEFNSLSVIVNDYILKTKLKIKTLREVVDQTEVSINEKGKYFLIGCEGEKIILKNNWAGIEQINELRYNPWTGKEVSEKFFELGRAELFCEIDSSGNRYQNATYKYGQNDELLSIHILNSESKPIKNIYMNTLENPYLIEIRVGDNKWFTWPSQLSWPIEDEKLDQLLIHERLRSRP